MVTDLGLSMASHAELRRRVLVCAVALGLAAGGAWAADKSPVATPQVWLSPAFAFNGHPGSVDNLELFKDGSPWAQARARVQVFKIAVHTLNQLPDADFAAMLKYLDQNHIALAVEYGMLTQSDSCGTGVEGFKPLNMPAHISERVKKLGGRIRYIAMDEPLFFGHFFSGHDACHWGIADIARNAAPNVKQFREQFPDIEIGDTEPVNNMKDGDWLDALREWLEDYRRETGTPLAFFHDDMIWREPIAARTRQLTQLLDSQGIKFGVIINSRGDVDSDQEWLASAKRNIDEYRASALKAPDQIIVQSWKPFPTHVLPESDPLTLTHLVNYYFDGR
jgi:hypothetical protein